MLQASLIFLHDVFNVTKPVLHLKRVDLQSDNIKLGHSYTTCCNILCKSCYINIYGCFIINAFLQTLLLK